MIEEDNWVDNEEQSENALLVESITNITRKDPEKDLMLNFETLDPMRA
ncbi:hypothetical protein UF75_3230 [Desulfosporosinus sp. I2]|nr:hypothetical protein UF75_3230 [Desulfosporosinus sp. I2]